MTRWRPTPPERGHRPARGVRFAAGTCPAPGCGHPFVLDRAGQPWARARTCSSECARRAGHAHRRTPNQHAAMVEEYRLVRDTQIQAREVSAADEDLTPVTFRDWLRNYQWERQDAA